MGKMEVQKIGKDRYYSKQSQSVVGELGVKKPVLGDPLQAKRI